MRLPLESGARLRNEERAESTLAHTGASEQIATKADAVLARSMESARRLRAIGLRRTCLAERTRGTHPRGPPPSPGPTLAFEPRSQSSASKAQRGGCTLRVLLRSGELLRCNCAHTSPSPAMSRPPPRARHRPLARDASVAWARERVHPCPRLLGSVASRKPAGGDPWLRRLAAAAAGPEAMPPLPLVAADALAEVAMASGLQAREHQ